MRANRQAVIGEMKLRTKAGVAEGDEESLEDSISTPTRARPMAPARTSNRRAQRDQNPNSAILNNAQPQQLVEQPKDDLFLEPMMGTPLALYVDKDVEDRDQIIQLITVCNTPLQQSSTRVSLCRVCMGWS